MQISGQASIETFLPFFLFSLYLFILVIIIIIIIFFLTGQRHGVLYHHWDLNYFHLYCATAIPRAQDSQPFFPLHSPRSSQFPTTFAGWTRHQWHYWTLLEIFRVTSFECNPWHEDCIMWKKWDENIVTITGIRWEWKAMVGKWVESI